MPARIKINREQLAEFCRRHHIRRLSFFGSVLRDDFRPDSDVDLLVEFAPDHIPGFAFFAMEEELRALLGRRVDLNTPGFFRPHLRKEVESSAEPVYVAASTQPNTLQKRCHCEERSDAAIPAG